MSWAMAGQMALDFVGNWYQSYIQKAQYDAQNTINEANTYSTNLVNNANADAANLVRKANNGFQAAQAALQNTQRNLNNREVMNAYGDKYAAINTNQSRLVDQMVRGNLSTQLRAASDLGALRAQSASRGVGGASAAIMRSVATTASGHEQARNQENQQYITFDALMQKAGILRASINSLDYGQSLPTLDYGINVAPLAQSPLNPGDFINPTASAILGTLSKNGKGLMQMLGEARSAVASASGSLAAMGEKGGASIGDLLGSGSGNTTTFSSFFNVA